MARRIIHIILVQVFFVAAINSQSINRFEYFIDTDPGAGNGIGFSVTPADSATLNIPLNANSLSTGHHIIGMRSRDNSGKWSHAEFAHLYVETRDTFNRQMIKAEFFIGDIDPGIGLARSIIINNPADSVTVIADSILNNLPLGIYKISVRFKDGRGVWSHLESRKLTVCSIYGAQSEMTYQVEGNKVFFTNNSLYQTGQLWKFGDATTSTLFNPIKTYSTAGNYNLQLITSNTCGNDTLNEVVQIRGLQNVNANRAGNSGIATLLFDGFGFTNTTNVKLMLGGQIINPVAKFLVSSDRMRANFDLTGAAPGIYRAIATLGSAFDTLNNAVTIEANVQADLTLTQTGGGKTRPTGERIISTITNPGSSDVIMVPYIATVNFIPGNDKNLNFFTTTDLVFLQTQGVFQQTYQYLNNHNVPLQVMAENNLDSARKRHTVAYYKVRIPAHSSVTELVKKPNPTNNLTAFQGGSMVQNPMMDSYALLGTIHTTYEPCYSTFLKHEVEKQLNIQINAAAWENCFAPAFNNLMTTLAGISQNPLYEKFAVPMQAGFSALLAEMAGCSGSGVPSNLGGIDFKRIVQGVMNNWIFQEDIDSLSADCIDTSVHFAEARIASVERAGIVARTTAGGCSDCPGNQIFPEMCETCGPILYAAKKGKKNKVLKRAFGTNSAFAGCQEWCESNSIDPNTKEGPGNNSDRKYINYLSDITYKIKFENLASATAPAAFVEIRDTIDKTVFDINSLQLGVLGWGDSILKTEANTKNISILKDIQPTHPNQLRVDATTDTTSGELKWRFWTLDLVNLQLTTNLSEGFLPPNTDGIKGTGYVTFTIKPRSTVTNGTVLQNKASIIFDQNAPISTGLWEHRIDTLKPLSAVNGLPATITTPNFLVSWNGTDGHSGIDKFSIYVSVNDSNYKLWRSQVTNVSDSFHGQFGRTYKFISIALDKAGNFEDPPINPLSNPDAVTTVMLPLPLDLLSFTATKIANAKVELTWRTANEINISHFELQRSANGSNYSAIGNVTAVNNLNGSSYFRLDSAPLSKMNYYRLRIIDIDGSYKFSPVRAVKMDDKETIFVFPTITKDLVFVQSSKELLAELFNMQGIRLQQKMIRRNTTFDLTNLSKGIYFIKVEGERTPFKIIRE